MDAYIVRLAVLVTVLFNPQVLMADPLVFDDGGEHIIDSLVTNDTIIIRAGTTVRVMSGGVTPTVELRGGQLLVDGGSVGGIIQSDSDDDSRFVMTAGEVRDFITKLGGHAEILGGTVVGNVRVTIGPLRVAGDALIGSISGGGFATGCSGSREATSARYGLDLTPLRIFSSPEGRSNRCSSASTMAGPSR